MFIQTEQTPNPASLKFLPGVPVIDRGSADFPDRGTADRSPLAQTLFEIEGVTRVFLGADFVTVTKADEQDWYVLKPSVLGALMEHFSSNRPVLLEDAGDGHADSENDSDVVSQIKELLDTRVRPAVAQDGGDITFHGFEKGVVYLTMKGSCSGCPSSTATLKAGIENLLRHFVPEVTEVRAVR
ncbi:MAG: NifU family protein [Azospirillaceae bacterium]|nr:NifU family protein [Azospirillaceae bacterium]